MSKLVCEKCNSEMSHIDKEGHKYACLNCIKWVDRRVLVETKNPITISDKFKKVVEGYAVIGKNNPSRMSMMQLHNDLNIEVYVKNIHLNLLQESMTFHKSKDKIISHVRITIEEIPWPEEDSED